MWKIATLTELVIILTLSLFIYFDHTNLLPNVSSDVATRTITQTKRETVTVERPGKEITTTVTEYITSDAPLPSKLPMWALTGGGRINLDGKRYWNLGLERRLSPDSPLHLGLGYDSDKYIISTVRLELR